MKLSAVFMRLGQGRRVAIHYLFCIFIFPYPYLKDHRIFERLFVIGVKVNPAKKRVSYSPNGKNMKFILKLGPCLLCMTSNTDTVCLLKIQRFGLRDLFMHNK